MQHKIATRFALFALGFLSIATQVYLIREFISTFYGNELVFGISLANWMLLTGVGAWLGRFFIRVKGQFSFTLFLLLLLSVLPALMIIKLDLFRAMVFPYGSMISLWQLIYTTLVIQLPFCLVNGYLFTALSLIGSDDNDWTNIPGAYAMESMGSLVAGILVNFIFLWLFNTFSGLLLITIVFLLLVNAYSWYFGRRSSFVISLITTAIIITCLFLPDFQLMTEKLLYKDQHVLANEGTPYGQVVITENENQLNYYENGSLLFSSGNLIRNEESVHFTMIQHSHPEKVLLVSGGISGAIREILKYHPKRIDYVELNPSLIKLAAKFTGQNKNPGIRTHITDARKFIKKTQDAYDVVLINLPEPSTLQVNRFYTLEFFTELKRKLNAGAVISLSLPTTSDYVSEQAGKLNSTIYQTLKKVFKNVLIIPVDKNYFLASDSLLNIDIPGQVSKKKIQTAYVNSYYFDTQQLQERSSYVLRNISADIDLNNDFRPVAFFYQLNYWLSYFGNSPLILGILLIVTSLIILVTLNPVSSGLFTGGFTGASVEVILVLALQIMFGYVFQMLGIVIMLFMLGLAVGSGVTTRLFRIPQVKHYIAIQLILSLFSFLLPLFLLWISFLNLPDWIIQAKIAGLTFFVSFLIGMEYRMASYLRRDNKVMGIATNYSAELFGSALGALVVTIFLIPLLGFVNTGIVLAILNMMSAAILIIRRKKIVPL